MLGLVESLRELPLKCLCVTAGVALAYNALAFLLLALLVNGHKVPVLVLPPSIDSTANNSQHNKKNQDDDASNIIVSWFVWVWHQHLMIFIRVILDWDVDDWEFILTLVKVVDLINQILGGVGGAIGGAIGGAVGGTVGGAIVWHNDRINLGHNIRFIMDFRGVGVVSHGEGALHAAHLELRWHAVARSDADLDVVLVVLCQGCLVEDCVEVAQERGAKVPAVLVIRPAADYWKGADGLVVAQVFVADVKTMGNGDTKTELSSSRVKDLKLDHEVFTGADIMAIVVCVPADVSSTNNVAVPLFNLLNVLVELCVWKIQVWQMVREVKLFVSSKDVSVVDLEVLYVKGPFSLRDRSKNVKRCLWVDCRGVVASKLDTA